MGRRTQPPTAPTGRGRWIDHQPATIDIAAFCIGLQTIPVEQMQLGIGLQTIPVEQRQLGIGDLPVGVPLMRVYPRPPLIGFENGGRHETSARLPWLDKTITWRMLVQVHH
jgi:hypothetical protein